MQKTQRYGSGSDIPTDTRRMLEGTAGLSHMYSSIGFHNGGGSRNGSRAWRSGRQKSLSGVHGAFPLDPEAKCKM